VGRRVSGGEAPRRGAPAERSMRRRLLSGDSKIKTSPAIKRLSAGKNSEGAVQRSPSYQSAISCDDAGEPMVPKRTTSLRPSGIASAPGSANSSPTPREGSRLARQSPAPPTQSKTLPTGMALPKPTSPGSGMTLPKPSSALRPPSKLSPPKSGLTQPRSALGSGLKAPSGLKRPGGIPKPK